MKKYNLPQDVKVFGTQVKTFPNGIGEAFDGLIKILPPGDKRAYYGISECTNEGITYNAAAAETYNGEAGKYGLETWTIERGDYLSETVMDWRAKTASIKNVFEEIFKSELSERSRPCIEIYKDDNEMVCMVKADQRKLLQTEWEGAAKELIELLSSFSQKQINSVPSEGSWTAGQVAQHLVMSGSGFAELLGGLAKETERAPGEFVAIINSSFLDFSTKMVSPGFVRPALTSYNKESLLRSLESIRESIIEAIKTLDLTETCLAFELPVMGYLTRLEALNFVISHTLRHIHQLKKIYNTVANKEVEELFQTSI